jgi:hypothetical protein
MRIAVQDRHVAMAAVARTEARAFGNQPLVRLAPLGRKPVAHAVGEAGEFARECGELRLARVLPGADRGAEARIVPQRGMEARLRLDDALTVRDGRRNRPDRRDLMRVGEILQQQMPRIGVGIPLRLEAARREPHRHHVGDIPIERDFLAPAAPIRGHPLGQSGLEDQRARRLRGRAVVGDAQPDDPRQDGATRALDRDIANAAVVEHAGAAQHRREPGGFDRSGQRIARHGFPLTDIRPLKA